jgi:hypothetical protein
MPSEDGELTETCRGSKYYNYNETLRHGQLLLYNLFSYEVVCVTVGASPIPDTQSASVEYSYLSLVPIKGFRQFHH